MYIKTIYACYMVIIIDTGQFREKTIITCTIIEKWPDLKNRTRKTFCSCNSQCKYIAPMKFLDIKGE